MIDKVEPDVVAIELCSNRTSILRLDEKKLLEEASNIDMSKMRQAMKQVWKCIVFMCSQPIWILM